MRRPTDAPSRRHTATCHASARTAPPRSLLPAAYTRLKHAVLHALSHHERLLLVLWYAERMTPAEVAMTLDLTEQQARRMHSEVVAKLRASA